MHDVPPHAYAGARAMVILHDRHLRSFLESWRRAKDAGIAPPRTSDPDYVSLDAILAHVCRAARGYMTWMCECLGLPDPEIRPAPRAETAAEEAGAYLDHLFDRWRTPLAGVAEARFGEVYDARWGTAYSIDAMLEHAVMHPIRHEFQLVELLGARRAR